MNSAALAIPFAALAVISAFEPSTTSAAANSTCKAGTVIALDQDTARSWAADAGSKGVDVRSRPAPRAKLTSHIAGHTDIGVVSVFRVIAKRVDRQCRGTWWRVQLPVRPNGSTGWIAANQLRPPTPVRHRIEIDLSAHRLTLRYRGRQVMRAAVGVGAAQTRTPSLDTYVREILLSTNAKGAYGPGALALAAHAPTLTDWARGGLIGIHGTNEPRSVGRDVSHGCIRVTNPTILRLLRTVPAGTPVRIVP